MSKSFKKSIFAVGVALLPVLALAQTNVQSILATVQSILDIVVPIIMALALIYFFWGLATYILGASADEEKRAAGRNMMIYGIIALFVMAAVWGLVKVVGSTFDVRTGEGPGFNPRNLIPR